ncbi:MAG: hypothetical protein R3E95_03890 [Thiolinea sp.]
MRKGTLTAERDNAYAVVDELLLNESACVPSTAPRDFGDAPSSYGDASHAVTRICISATCHLTVKVAANTATTLTVTAIRSMMAPVPGICPVMKTVLPAAVYRLRYSVVPGPENDGDEL